MKTKEKRDNPQKTKSAKPLTSDLTGYPYYPESEDIVNRSKKEKSPDELQENIDSNAVDSAASNDIRIPNDNIISDGLDVPGSELDDEQEKIGNEDEENNYYSLGSDNHNDLDEN